MRALDRKGRGSGLIVVLAVLAMLAIMATTFVTLTRLETRVATNYVDDFRCEMLARGMLSYFTGILRDDSDRLFSKYVNRQMPVGSYRWKYDYDVSMWKATSWIPGLGEEAWGTRSGRSFWYYSPAPTWGDYSALFGDQSNYGPWFQPQGTFSYDSMTIGRYWDGAKEVDAWIDRTLNARDGRGVVVSLNHPQALQELNDDGSGSASPMPTDPGYDREVGSDGLYYDAPPFITSAAGGSKFFAGNLMTGEAALSGGMYWRWGAKMGIPTTTYLDLNVAGNLDGGNTQYLDNMGNIGLRARRALDESCDWSPYSGTDIGSVPGGPCGPTPQKTSDHLGRIEWRGFDQEYHNNFTNGFPINYDIVYWHPSQIGLERAFMASWYRTTEPMRRGATVMPITKPGSSVTSVMVGREKARALIQVRSGRNDGIPGKGTDPWRVGWRRDGASYYKLPNPDNPIEGEHYFGTNEIIEHDHSTYHGRTSAIANVLGKEDERAIRPYCSLYSTDTILRGKIWPDEGLPYTAGAGDWRHINILKRVNLNIIGAKLSRPGDPAGDEVLKNRWANKAVSEQARLYYMLVAAMNFTNTDTTIGRKKQACQFIASLIDMVDRDHDETYYAAPDGSGAWGLGVEKFPVINEVSFYCGRNASAATWELTSLRIELLNTAENIPWIPDADEGYDVSNYVLRFISSLGSPRTYRLGTLRRYDAMAPDTDLGLITTIGADGMYAAPNDNSPTHKSWSRLLHIGWPKVGTTWWPPDGITQTEMRGSIKVQLWKPLTGDAQNNITADGVNVATIMGGSQKYLRVDEAGPFWLVGPYGGWAGPGGTYLPTYLGLYRRWDPMNGKPTGSPSFSTSISWATTSAWVQGATLTSATLGKPNSDASGLRGYSRVLERNFKVVDGDLPSIGWLGELFMWNIAEKGPLTQLHSAGAVVGWQSDTWGAWSVPGDLDTKAKFDLYRPFVPVTPTPHYNPDGNQVDPKNLHVLDIFTVWDPSNDNVDNDGDGAVDDADTGLQAGDKGGPEVRVYGKLDLNHIPLRVWNAILPHNQRMYNFFNNYNPPGWEMGGVSYGTILGREGQRGANGDYMSQGPFETIGDCLRYDKMFALPGRMFAYMGIWPTWSVGNFGPLGEVGFLTGDRNDGPTLDPATWHGDDDGDGMFDERDERDLLWTWLSSFFTTRANVFQVDLNVDICDPPYHPGPGNLPFKTYKSRRTYARKQLLGILDRSTTLRIRPDGTCDFGGPVDVRLLRFSDDLRID